MATATACTTTTVEGRNRFVVAGYSATKGAAAGHRVVSGTFTVGGFEWAVAFYPEGVTAADRDYISLYFEIKHLAGVATATAARAFYDISIVHPVTGESRSAAKLPGAAHAAPPRVFSSAFPSWGHPRFMRWREMEAAGFVAGDRLTVDCVVNVIQDPVVTAGESPEHEQRQPPSNILDHIAGLLGDIDTADVTFAMNSGELLAARSPVFKAELYGAMKESSSNSPIAIDGVEPAAFKSLLQFIYTDKIADEFDGDDEMIPHLLEVADRYDVMRMKLMCELMLCKSIAVDNVAARLALADQHHCQKLKEACVEFLATSKMESVLESQGYKNIKFGCPSFMVDLWEIIGRKMSSYSVIPKIHVGNN